MRAHGFQHAEAFCLMKYASRDGTTVEWLWNSRDGVTPFIIHSKDGVEMNHVDFHLDRCLPQYQPLPGERVFVDLTEERAREGVVQRVALYWDDPQSSMAAMFATQEEAIAQLTTSYYQPGAPMIVTGAEWRKARDDGL